MGVLGAAMRSTAAAGGDDTGVFVVVQHGERASGHSLLLELAAELGVAERRVTVLPSGAPVLAGLVVSVSYTRELVAVAASRQGVVGIDVEARRPIAAAPLSRRHFCAEEADEVAEAADPVGVFLRLWTAKEAVGKALGVGLRQGGLARRAPSDGGPIAGIADLRVDHTELATGAVLAVAHRPRAAVLVVDRSVAGK